MHTDRVTYSAINAIFMQFTNVFSPSFGSCLFFADKDLSYDHLASGLKEALENDKSVFDADRLQKFTGIATLW